MSARVAFRTLGCKLNQYETESIAAEFDAAGYTVVPFAEVADVYVINSCTITSQADRKSRNLVYRALRTGGAESSVVLTGCFAERNAGGHGDDPRVMVVGNEQKSEVFPLVDARLRAGAHNGPTAGPSPVAAAAPGPAQGGPFGFRAARGMFHTRAAIKIQDGCDQFCTYCIVPHVRGRAVSREPADILRETRGTVAGGAREIVVTGVNLGRYRHGELDFTELLRRLLDEIPGDGGVRVRISSLEPEGLDERFSSLFADPRLSPHVHLCLQSGSDAILGRMGRRYRSADFRRIADSLRSVDPMLNLTTDIIVGFPGETEAEFEASVSAVREIGFSHIHVFPFSPREGTPAARMPDQVPAAVKSRRARRLRELSAELKRQYYARLVGKREKVLVEKVDAALPATAVAAPATAARGYGRYYVPVLIPQAGLEQNAVYEVDINRLLDTPDGPVLLGST
ncbi:MAG: tRNA (N(6)-L-threonylcarbamoyladenosine(37)-C(2))-methylthiotransferase MtaB [Spirochaetes bacterium]|nr:tRNA (N(6)-L-threonylcarbamoyladenosine(37)-C(2))-methylthiotransferase MtaB [Spirochaetota bacterium]